MNATDGPLWELHARLVMLCAEDKITEKEHTEFENLLDEIWRECNSRGTG